MASVRVVAGEPREFSRSTAVQKLALPGAEALRTAGAQSARPKAFDPELPNIGRKFIPVGAGRAPRYTSQDKSTTRKAPRMRTNSGKTFDIRADMFDSLRTRTILERPPAGLDVAELDRLDWHIRNAAQAVSGTAQMVSYNGLVDFVASHYAKLLGVPQSDDLNELTIRVGLKGGLSRIRKAESVSGVQFEYRALVKNIGGFLDEATETPSGKPTPESTRRRAIANALWLHWREHEDRADVELEDLPLDHSVWAEADAVMAVLALEPAPQLSQPPADDQLAEEARRYRWIRQDNLRRDKQDRWAPRIGVSTKDGGTMYRYVETAEEHDISVDRAMKAEPNPV